MNMWLVCFEGLLLYDFRVFFIVVYFGFIFVVGEFDYDVVCFFVRVIFFYFVGFGDIFN